MQPDTDLDAYQGALTRRYLSRRALATAFLVVLGVVTTLAGAWLTVDMFAHPSSHAFATARTSSGGRRGRGGAIPPMLLFLGVATTIFGRRIGTRGFPGQWTSNEPVPPLPAGLQAKAYGAMAAGTLVLGVVASGGLGRALASARSAQSACNEIVPADVLRGVTTGGAEILPARDGGHTCSVHVQSGGRDVAVFRLLSDDTTLAASVRYLAGVYDDRPSADVPELGPGSLRVTSGDRVALGFERGRGKLAAAFDRATFDDAAIASIARALREREDVVRRFGE